MRRTSAAAVARPVRQRRATRSSRTSSERVFPDRFSALVIFRYGVASAASMACVGTAHSAMATSFSYRYDNEPSHEANNVVKQGRPVLGRRFE